MTKLAYDIVEPSECRKELCPIIFLHGASCSKEIFSDVIPAVADATKRKIFSVDFRNHGDSDWVGDFDFKQNVGDLFEFMDDREIEKAILVGHSMGGFTAIRAALAAPERIAGVVVEDMTVSAVNEKALQTALAYGGMFESMLELVPPGCDYKTAVKSLMDNLYQQIPDEVKHKFPTYAPEKFKFALKQDASGKWRFKANIREILRATHKIGDQDYCRVEGTFEGPACFIYGKMSDFAVADDEETIKTHFPSAELHGIEGADHGVHLENLEDFNQTVIKFLSEINE